MLGVFGAGVVTALQEADIYPLLHSVYGTSAGSHDAAYFLARQSRLGSSIYYEDLVGGDFVRPKVFFHYLTDVIISKFRRHRPIRHILNLDLLEIVEATRKRLDIEALKKQPIPFFVLVYNQSTRQIEFRDGTHRTLDLLKASSAIPPYYTKPVEIDGQQYVDGGLAHRSDIIQLIERNADKHIIYVINNPKTILGAIIKLPLFFLECLLVAATFGMRLAMRFFVHELTFMTARHLAHYPNVQVAMNTLPRRHNFLNRQQLLALYEHGQEQGRAVVDQLVSRH